ncbi:MAG TPA: CHASE2 domain-containing protein [Verrucomicrobiae bacterium]|jgi:CHASE2 domain-containing sensor protein|nr:CHASE2 domain-containing protein [Verrucomicrobiae bacterium]
MFFRPLAAAAAATVCGLGLWATTFGEKSSQETQETIGEKWEWASYDYLFHFGTPAFTNNVVVILMDNDSYTWLGQVRSEGWDRSLHAQLLNQLADDKCPLVVFDVEFLKAKDRETDEKLAAAMHRLRNLILAADMTSIHFQGMDSVQPKLPWNIFLTAAHTNWGLMRLDADLDTIVRRHWPFPTPGPYPTLPWAAAALSGVHLSDAPRERWLRYYDFRALPSLSYRLALNEPANYFHDKIVFIGNDPHNTYANEYEDDKFNSPEKVLGGVEVVATSYLNLVRGDWLRRAGWPVEVLAFIMTGAISGMVLSRFSRWRAIGVTFILMLLFSLAGIGLSQLTNYWFPWLMVVGAQVPCALAVAVLVPLKVKVEAMAEKPQPASDPKKTIVLSFPEEKPPDAPDYELLQPPIGEGSFGKVWIVRNAIGQWQALKAVYQSKFGANRHPYESEFRGLQKYKPVSEKHSGLLRIDLVSKMKDEGYFYYVMELGDAQAPGWENDPSTYKPRDLENMRKRTEGPLPLAECVRIGATLADALNFLHSQGLTHRDIKPSNVIFVNGRPKLADIGLVTDIRPPDKINTFVGTPGYMPPPPEVPGTPLADIYAMGMLLYVISTGFDPKFFPDIATTMMERRDHAEFVRFDAIVLKACQPDSKQRYQTAGEMLRDLEKAGQPA